MFVQSSAYFISFEFSVYLVVPTVITAFKTIVVSDDLRLIVLLTFLCSQPARVRQVRGVLRFFMAGVSSSPMTSVVA